MLSIYLLIGITIILLLIAVFYLARNSNYKVFTDISYKLTNLQTDIHHIELAVKTEIATNDFTRVLFPPSFSAPFVAAAFL